MSNETMGLDDVFEPEGSSAADDFGGYAPDGGNHPDKGDVETVDGVTIDYTVEPPATRLGGRGPKWPWHAVRVGGSIRFDDPKMAQSALNSAKRWAKRQPEPQPEFVSRSMGSGVYRVFRTK